MNLDRPELDSGVWPSTVSIQEHELAQPPVPMPAAAMPSIPSTSAKQQSLQQQLQQPPIGLPRVDSDGGGGSTSASAAAPPSAPLPSSMLANGRVSAVPGSEPAAMGSLLSMDLGDLDASLGGMDDLGVGDIFTGSQSPLAGNSAASPATNYNIVSAPTPVMPKSLQL